MSISYDQKTWVSKDPITADAMNNMEEGIGDCVDRLNDICIDTTLYAAANHNGIFRGKNLTSVYTVDELSEMISAGTFDDLYIGDYYDQTMSTDFTSSETVRWVFAGFDCFYQYGDTACTTHHAVMVPLNGFAATSVMNSTNTTEGGYVGSYMWTDVLPVYATAIQENWGEDHVLSHRQYLTTTMTDTTASMAGSGYTGATTAGAWTDVTISLMNEAMVYGTTVCSSSRWDNTFPNQLPLFALAPHYRRAGTGGTSTSSRNNWWLSSVASSAYFALVGYTGDAYANNASNTICVRPYLLLA